MRRLVILWIVVFMVLVVLHEFGHFIAARKCWMKVPEFWIWLPPKACNLWKDKKWTQYTLNWIPLGWFCQIEWDDPTDKKSFDNPNTLFTAPLWKRLIVIFAWITMNFLTAWIIFTWIFWYWVHPLSISDMAEEKWSTSYLMASESFLREQSFLTWDLRILVTGVKSDSYANKIWLQKGDILIKIDDKNIDYSDFFEFKSVWDFNSHTLTVRRWNKDEVIKFVCQNTSCDFWFNYNYNVLVKFWLWWAMLAAFQEIWAEWNLTMDALWILWKGLFSFNKWEMKDALNNLSGPVGAVKIWWMFYEMWWWWAYFAFAAIISLALAIFNVLPIPALDWGRAVWMILQAIFKVKPEKYFKYEWYVNMFFFYLILLLWVIIIIKDLVVFWGVNIPFIS